MTGPYRRSSWRELALVGSALLLPIPLLVLGGRMVPLPSVVERSIASLLPPAIGTLEGATAPAAAGEVGSGSVERRRPAPASPSISSEGVAASQGTATAGTQDNAGPGGAGAGSGHVDLPSGGNTPQTDDDNPATDDDTPATSPRDTEVQVPGAAPDSDTTPNMRVTGGAQGTSVGISTSDGVTVGSEPNVGSQQPGGSVAVAPGDGSTTEAGTSDLPTLNLPIP